MEIKAGREYRTRDGQQARIAYTDFSGAFPVSGEIGTACCAWTADGRVHADTFGHPLDLVAEWSDPPQHAMEPLGKEFEEVWDANTDTLYEDTPPQPDAHGWIEWSGGECPVAPETMVEVVLSGWAVHLRLPAKVFNWRTAGSFGICRYRIVSQPDAAPAKAEGPVEQPKMALADRLEARLTLAWMGNCKCGNCQLVDADDLREVVAFLRAADVTLTQLATALRAMEGQSHG